MNDIKTHTPGPWTYWENMNDIYAGREQGVYICAMNDMDTNTADTRLISAAPDLAAALRRFAAEWEEGHVTVGAYEDAVAAIAKAEGAS